MKRLSQAPFPIITMPVGPFAMNEYLVICPDSGDAALVDSGGPPEPFLAAADEQDARIIALLQTHAHVDHIAGLAATRAAIDAPIWLHEDERAFYDAAERQGSFFGLPCEQPPPPEKAIEDGDQISVGALTFRALLTPGHSPGHICFYEEEQGVLLGGDLLFRGSIGRVDLPGCDPDAMRASLGRIMTLPDEVLVCPGHMGETTIGQERRTNPFIRGF